MVDIPDGPEEQLVVQAGIADDAALDRFAYMDEGAELSLYATDAAGEEEVIDAGDVQAYGLGSLRDYVADVVRDNPDAAGKVREVLADDDYTLTIRILDAADADTDIDGEGLEDYGRVDGVEYSPLSQEVMEHEYREGICNWCGGDMDFLVADPETDDLDIYLYNCDDCGHSGHYFGGQEHEDGGVVIDATITDRDELQSATADLREGAEVIVYDLDEMEDPDRTERAAVTGIDYLDAPVQLSDGVTFRVYPVDGPHDVETVWDDEVVYEKVVERSEATTVGGLLDRIVEDDPSLAHELAAYVADEDRSLTVELEVPQTVPGGFDERMFDHYKEIGPLEAARIHSHNASRDSDITVEELLKQAVRSKTGGYDVGTLKGGKHLAVPEDTRDEIWAQLEEPNLGLHIQDMTGGSDVDGIEEGSYAKLVDHSVQHLGKE